MRMQDNLEYIRQQSTLGDSFKFGMLGGKNRAKLTNKARSRGIPFFLYCVSKGIIKCAKDVLTGHCPVEYKEDLFFLPYTALIR